MTSAKHTVFLVSLLAQISSTQHSNTQGEGAPARNRRPLSLQLSRQFNESGHGTQPPHDLKKGNGPTWDLSQGDSRESLYSKAKGEGSTARNRRKGTSARSLLQETIS
jgi:hypothetical protein